MHQTNQMAPANYYNDQLNKLATQVAATKKKADLVAWGRVIIILLDATAVYTAIRNGNTGAWIAALVLTMVFLYILWWQGKLKDLARRLEIHEQILHDELKALEGDNSSFDPGERYVKPSHEFSYDLDIFGERSVYQALNRTATTRGADTLAKLLQSPYATPSVVADRQQAIKELAEKVDFIHRFRITGKRVPEETGAGERLSQWLEMDDIFRGNKLVTVLLYSVPALSLLFITLSFFQGRLHPGLMLMIAINWAVNIRHAKKVRQAHYLVGESVKLIDQTEHLLKQVAGQDFAGNILRTCKSNSEGSIAAITGLKKLVHLFDNRQNGMAGPLLNSLFLFDVYCITGLEKWRNENRDKLADAVQLVADMDSYCSLGNYAFNSPGNTYPVMDTSSVVIRGTEVSHPLLHKNTAVGNSFSLGADEQLYLLTGANMTGKSTFIRTVGVNLILAYLGVPLPAASFSFPQVKLFTSIRITDSVQDDVSYFKAELQRMRRLMQEAGNSNTPYLVLLDEPLRGTNSADKQAGTMAIIEKLLSYQTIGIIATHDTNLCTLAEKHKGKISNYHFESKVSGGALQFDYKLEQGGSTSNNATVLMKMMGIID